MVKINPAELRVEMALRGWTQPMLAEKAEINQSTVSRALTSGQIGAVTAYKIGKALQAHPPLKSLESVIERQVAS